MGEEGGEKGFVGEHRSRRRVTISIYVSPLLPFLSFRLFSQPSFFSFFPFVSLFLSLSLAFHRKNAREIFWYYSKKKKKKDSERVRPIIRIDRSFLIGPFRPIKIEFFREPRKRRSNGLESDFGRS